MKKILFSILCLTFLVGFSEIDEIFNHDYDISYFNNHPDVRDKVLFACTNNSSQLNNTLNCNNAKQSKILEDAGYFSYTF